MPESAVTNGPANSNSANSSAESEKLRLLTIHAHPDDESSKGAATCARYVHEGHEVLVLTCTGGEAGSILNPAMESPEVEANMPAVRREEMAEAARILGVQHRWMGFVDSGLPEGDPLPPLPEGCFALVPLEISVAEAVKAIREFRPHVVVTYPENGGYPHPDHIRCHEVSVAAFDAAGDPARFPEAGPAWQPWKLYYEHAFSRTRTQAMHEAMLAEGLESPYTEWLKMWEEQDAANSAGDEAQAGSAAEEAGEDAAGEEAEAKKKFRLEDPSSRVTTRVVCDEFFETRDDALRAHATQIDPNSRWFAIPLGIQRKVWPTEDYELVKSFVDTELPEDDLFAGVREKVQS